MLDIVHILMIVIVIVRQLDKVYKVCEVYNISRKI